MNLKTDNADRYCFKQALFKAVVLCSLVANSTTALSETTNLRDLRLKSPAESMPFKRPVSLDERERELSVLSRNSPSYNPQNIRLGEFIVAPSIENIFSYTDNVYSTDNNKEQDSIYTVRPEVIIRSDFTLHQLEADFFVQDGNFKRITEEDYTDYGARISGRYDLPYGLAIPLSFDYQKAHSQRDDPQDRRSIDPVVFNIFRGGTGLRMSGNYLEIGAATGYEQFKHDDTTSFSGTRIDNSDRDRMVFLHSLTVGVPQTAIFSPFVYGKYKTITYDQGQDNFGISRDSSEQEFGVGTGYNFSRVTKSTFQIGKVHREFDVSSAEPIDAFAYSLDLNWEPSTLAAFSLTGERGIEETFANAEAQIQTSLILGMTYEVSPNLLLNPEIRYRQREYQESSGFEAVSYGANLEATYKFSPNIWSIVEYNYATEEQKGDNSLGFNTNGYDENRISLSLKLQL